MIYLETILKNDVGADVCNVGAGVRLKNGPLAGHLKYSSNPSSFLWGCFQLVLG